MEEQGGMGGSSVWKTTGIWLNEEEKADKNRKRNLHQPLREMMEQLPNKKLSQKLFMNN